MNFILPITILVGCAAASILLVVAAAVNWRRIDGMNRLVGVLSILSLLCMSAALLAAIQDSPVVSNVFRGCFAALIIPAGLILLHLRRNRR